MRISYRMTSSAVVAVYVAGIIYSVLFSQTARPTETAATDGAVSFDLCNMWEQMSAMKQIGALLWGTSFMVLLVQGLRNRPVRRWVTVVGLVSLGVTLWYDRWRVENCWTGFTFVAMAAVIAMYVHQLLPRSHMMSN
jgi:hypothetical protein